MLGELGRRGQRRGLTFDFFSGSEKDRVAPGGFPPGLPQTRTCAINAFGSSSYPFATRRHTEWIARR